MKKRQIVIIVIVLVAFGLGVTLACTPIQMQADLPAGGKRLMQGTTGYVATLVNGVPITRDGKLTGARPGRLVRSA